MEIKSNMGAGGVPEMTPSKRSAQSSQSSSDGVSFTSSQALDAALESSPNVRPEQVQRARELINDPNYPPMVTIRKFSALLAIHIDSVNE